MKLQSVHDSMLSQPYSGGEVCWH